LTPAGKAGAENQDAYRSAEAPRHPKASEESVFSAACQEPELSCDGLR